MTVLAFITDPRVLVRILDHIGLPSSPPPLDPPRLPSDLDLEFDFDLTHDDTVDSWDAHEPERTSDWDARPPPHPPPHDRREAPCGSGHRVAHGDDLHELGLDCYEGH
jgi:hypothetical protein